MSSSPSVLPNTNRKRVNLRQHYSSYAIPLLEIMQRIRVLEKPCIVFACIERTLVGFFCGRWVAGRTKRAYPFEGPILQVAALKIFEPQTSVGAEWDAETRGQLLQYGRRISRKAAGMFTGVYMSTVSSDRCFGECFES
jgi:hypothetical protein